MRFPVRFPVIAAAVIAASSLSVASAKAERLQVPFSFSIGSKTLPAGEYTVNRDNTTNFVILKSMDGRTSYHWVLTPGEPDPSATKVALLFDALDSGYVLQSVQYHSKVTHRLDKSVKGSEDAPVHVIRGE